MTSAPSPAQEKSLQERLRQRAEIIRACRPSRLRRDAPLMIAAADALDEVSSVLAEAREVMQAVLDRMFDTIGHEDERPVHVEDTNGEKCWIVDHESIDALRAFLTAHPEEK